MASKVAAFVLFVLLEVNSNLSQCVPSNGRQIVIQPVTQQACDTCSEKLLPYSDPYQSLPYMHYQPSEPLIIKPTVSTVVEPCSYQAKNQYQSYAPVRPATATVPVTTIVIQEDDDQGVQPLLFYTMLLMMNRDCNNYNYNDRYRYPYNDYYGNGRRNSYGEDCRDYNRYNYGNRNCYDKGCNGNGNSYCGDDGNYCYTVDKDCDGSEINLIIRPNDC